MAIQPSAVGASLGETTSSWDADDVILYHLGLGAGVPPTDPNELVYCYERDLKVLPTFMVNGSGGLVQRITDVEGISFDFVNLLHGQQDTIVHAPVSTSGKAVHTGRIAEIWDKGSGALIVMEVDSHDSAGLKLVTNRSHFFIRGEGDFGGESGPKASDPTPDRDPDLVVERSTLAQQALLYRLSGDKNPLHVDPAVARSGGFDTPLLHGLCTYGIVAKAVTDEMLGGDPTSVAEYTARFAAPVFPGETIRIAMWERDDEVIVNAAVVERDASVLANTVIRKCG